MLSLDKGYLLISRYDSNLEKPIWFEELEMTQREMLARFLLVAGEHLTKSEYRTVVSMKKPCECTDDYGFEWDPLNNFAWAEGSHTRATFRIVPVDEIEAGKMDIEMTVSIYPTKDNGGFDDEPIVSAVIGRSILLLKNDLDEVILKTLRKHKKECGDYLVEMSMHQGEECIDCDESAECHVDLKKKVVEWRTH